ncbi:MAG: hypothetical protein BZ135_07640 [Methanosphaera sp. rholeuAM6]|nr:MAG: hypothetical protein BZ135_07640 [Methanosphaera sp. rholeuAM6]
MIKVKYWKPNVNEELEGILVEKLDNEGIYGSNLYRIKCDDTIVNVWGKKQLDSIMEMVQVGDNIRLKYLGVKPVKDYEMKVYELEVLNE